MADRGREALDFSDDVSEDGLYHPSSSPHPPSSRLNGISRPLIDYVRNEWQSGAKYTNLTSGLERSESPKWVQMVLSIVTAPRFRRYVVVYLGLVVSCWLGWQFFLSPILEENSAILQSLDPQQKGNVGGWFGANALPQLEDVIQVRELDSALLPASSKSEDGEVSEKRLIVIGDVHGCINELERLLDETSFDPLNDHLIFTGDLIDKGPDSPAVVDLARDYNASCVRGNHEDRVLTFRHDMLASNLIHNALDETAPDYKVRKLARQLNDDQAKWLDACPVILHVGQIVNMGQVVVVHAGLVPGVTLDKQDPYSVMNMRTIDLPTHVPSASRDKGIKWTKLFNKHQSISSSQKDDPGSSHGPLTVIYGHDAKSGLSLKKYTKGLDSGCVKGGKLTALVISGSGAQKTVQVQCANHYKGDK